MTKNRIIAPIAAAIELSKLWGETFPIRAKDLMLEVASKKRDPIVKVEALDLNGADGFLGRTKKGRWGVGYSTRIRETGKVNFVLGHEFGHYICHREDKSQILCNKDDLNNFRMAQSDLVDIEQEANEFSSYLLMPLKDFREQVADQRITIDLLAHCSSRYDVSLTSAALKLVASTPKAVAIMVSENGQVKWSKSSEGARNRGYLYKRGTLLPTKSQSIVCSINGISKNNKTGAVVAPGIWAQDCAVIESAIAQPYYNSVFTILEFQNNDSRWERVDELDEAKDSFDHFRSYSRP